MAVDGQDKPYVVGGLSSLTFTNKSSDTFTCNGTGGACSGTASTTAAEDSVHMRDIYRRLQDVTAEGSEAGSLQEALANSKRSIVDVVPLATRMRTAPESAVVTADFIHKSNNNIGLACIDIARAIHYLNLNAAAPAHIRNGTKIFACQRGGWDSHSNQSGIANNIQNVGKAIGGLVKYLDQWGLLDSTLIVVDSEFARTSAQNGSLGTDHAEAGHCLVVGGSNLVRRGVYGPEASAAQASTANFFTAQVPFTGVLRNVLERSFDPSGLNQVFIEPMPGQVPNFLA